MRVVFDAFWWVEGPYSNRMVQRELITAWLRHYPEDRAVLVVPAGHVARARAELSPAVEVAGTRLRPHGVAITLGLPWVARRAGADVTVSHNFTPISGPAVTFIHDVLFATNPEWFTTAERAYFAPIVRLAPLARRVATSSATEADRIRTANPRLKSVTPIGLAIGTHLARSRPTRPAGLPALDGFLLTVGRLNARKNLARTIQAAIDSECLTARHPLVVVGELDGRRADMGGAAQKACDDGRVVLLSRMSESALAWLYANTSLFLYLSLDEGFGLPPHEAAHFGAPVLVSDIPVFRETLGERALFVHPQQSPQIAAAIRAALDEGRAPAAGMGRRAQPDEQSPDEAWAACAARLRVLAEQAAGQ